jgi:hypothetical protein
MEQVKAKRRSHWQYTAAIKYRRMRFAGGDGQQIVMTMCTEPWAYKLYSDYIEASCARARSCGPNCQGEQYHRHWKLIDAKERKAREELRARAKQEPQPVDEGTLDFWERNGV